MLLIAEIILTIFAWRNGWRWLSLLPIGITLLISFFIGFIVGFNGGDATNLSGIFILDIMTIIVLIMMVTTEKSIKKEE